MSAEWRRYFWQRVRATEFGMSTATNTSTTFRGFCRIFSVTRMRASMPRSPSNSAQGHSFSLPHPLEVELAERLTRIIPCAEKVRFGKNGSDATSGAVRAARALTGRERIACCGYHGWQDWYIGSTTRNAGVPEAVRALTHPFQYNNLESLRNLMDEHPGEFAAVIMEPVNFLPPAPGFLEGVKELTHRHGALLIFDEICTGFHFGLGGAQKKFGVTPDMACFGKAMGNGFPDLVHGWPVRRHEDFRRHILQLHLRRRNRVDGGGHEGAGCSGNNAGHRANRGERASAARGAERAGEGSGIAGPHSVHRLSLLVADQISR